tara:strand:+ start:555 stop:998 length:444 start_codon:yes stop_codon:yes gene_type:complete
MARRSKLTPAVTRLFVQALELNMTIDLASKYAGITPATFYNWINRGHKEGAGEYFEFMETVNKAMAKAALVNMALIQKAANNGTWQASAWILERRFPDDFGRQRKEPEVVLQIDAKEASITQLIQQVKQIDVELQDLIDDPVIDLDE